MRYKFEGGNLGLNLKCFKPLKNLREVEDSHRSKRYIRGETLKFLDRTVGKGKHGWETIEKHRNDIEQKVLDNNSYIKGGKNKGSKVPKAAKGGK